MLQYLHQPSTVIPTNEVATAPSAAAGRISNPDAEPNGAGKRPCVSAVTSALNQTYKAGVAPSASHQIPPWDRRTFFCTRRHFSRPLGIGVKND